MSFGEFKYALIEIIFTNVFINQTLYHINYSSILHIIYGYILKISLLKFNSFNDLFYIY